MPLLIVPWIDAEVLNLNRDQGERWNTRTARGGKKEQTHIREASEVVAEKMGSDMTSAE